MHIERNGTHGGLYNGYQYMLNMGGMDIEATCEDVSAARFDGTVTNANGTVTLSEVLVAKQGGSATDTPFDMLALQPFQTISKIHLMDRPDHARLLRATISKFWIEKR